MRELFVRYVEKKFVKHVVRVTIASVERRKTSECFISI